MKIFLDTVDIFSIQEFAEIGLIDGVTTNPSIIAKSKKPYIESIKEICDIVKGPVSAEVIATDYENMLKEADILNNISEYVVIKLPITLDGLRACNKITSLGMKTNMTLCFSESQALLAAKAGATYVSPFIGRLDDIGQDGMSLINNICSIYGNYPEIKTNILAASIRNVNQITQSFMLGAQIVTISPTLLKEMIRHNLTDIGIEKFLNDWNSSGQRI